MTGRRKMFKRSALISEKREKQLTSFSSSSDSDSSELLSELVLLPLELLVDESLELLETLFLLSLLFSLAGLACAYR